MEPSLFCIPTPLSPLGGSIAQWLALLLPDPAAQGLTVQKSLIVDGIHPVLAIGKLVLKNFPCNCIITLFLKRQLNWAENWKTKLKAFSKHSIKGVTAYWKIVFAQALGPPPPGPHRPPLRITGLTLTHSEPWAQIEWMFVVNICHSKNDFPRPISGKVSILSDEIHLSGSDATLRVQNILF